MVNRTTNTVCIGYAESQKAEILNTVHCSLFCEPQSYSPFQKDTSVYWRFFNQINAALLVLTSYV